jgi:ATP-dependent RNA helicase DeaD
MSVAAPADDDSPSGAPLAAASAPTPASGFAELGLPAQLVAPLVHLGYEEPTPIQRAAIPALLAGRDLLGQAATGTGKTAAFALPMLARIAALPERKGPAGLVLVPTRELAMQVAEAIYRYGRDLGTRVLPIYGGQPIERQLRGLRTPIDVIVATPGRALDHLRRTTLRLDQVAVVVLDEADEMLDMGFADDLDALLDAVPKTRQTALFSATFPARLAEIAGRHLREPARITISREAKAKAATAKVRHTAYIVPRAHKLAALGRLLDLERLPSTLVFCRTRTEVDTLTESMSSRGLRAEALHGGLSQDQRDRVMRRFRAGTTDLLVATDVAARGLDIEHLSHVVNYDVPPSPEVYVHRTGRTGRAGREGVAITLVEPREHRLLRNIGVELGHKIEVATLPTVADLRARRLELTGAGVRELLADGDLDRFRRIVEHLAAEADVVDVAAAALKLAHIASGREREEEEIPAPPPRPERDARGPGARSDGPRGPGRFGRSQTGGGPGGRPGGEGMGARPPRRPLVSPVETGGKSARLFVALGRADGVRPADLVGAICNETGLSSKAIGAIQITDRYALVEVPDAVADELVEALRGTFVKGQKLKIKRDGDTARGPIKKGGPKRPAS